MIKPIWKFHGTKISRWAGIQKDGLIPSAPKNWPDGQDEGGFYHFPRDSFPGIYLTENLITAWGSCHRGNHRDEKTEGDLLIIVEDHGASLLPDEDHILPYLLKTHHPDTQMSPYGCIILQACAEYPRGSEDKKFLKQAEGNYIRSLDKLLDENDAGWKKLEIQKMLGTLFPLALNRNAAWAAETEPYLWDDQTGKKPKPDRKKAEREFRIETEKIIDQLDYLAQTFLNTRSLAPITWTGEKIKIHGAYHFKNTQLIPITPSHLDKELIKEIEEKIGHQSNNL